MPLPANARPHPPSVRFLRCSQTSSDPPRSLLTSLLYIKKPREPFPRCQALLQAQKGGISHPLTRKRREVGPTAQPWLGSCNAAGHPERVPNATSPTTGDFPPAVRPSSPIERRHPAGVHRLRHVQRNPAIHRFLQGFIGQARQGSRSGSYRNRKHRHIRGTKRSSDPCSGMRCPIFPLSDRLPPLKENRRATGRRMNPS